MMGQVVLFVLLAITLATRSTQQQAHHQQQQQQPTHYVTTNNSVSAWLQKQVIGLTKQETIEEYRGKDGTTSALLCPWGSTGRQCYQYLVARDSRDVTNRQRYQRQTNGDSLRPPVPTSISVTSTTSSTIDLQWQYDDSLDGVVFSLRVSKQGKNGSNRLQQSTDTTATLSGLSPDTQYRITISAAKRLPNGRSAYSAETSPLIVSTQASSSSQPLPSGTTVPPETTVPPRTSVPPRTVPSFSIPTNPFTPAPNPSPGFRLFRPKNLRATRIGASSVDLQWQYEGLDEGVTFAVRAQGGFSTRLAESSETTKTITNLKPNTAYSFTISASMRFPDGRKAFSGETERLTITTISESQLPPPGKPVSPGTTPPTPPGTMPPRSTQPVPPMTPVPLRTTSLPELQPVTDASVEAPGCSMWAAPGVSINVLYQGLQSLLRTISGSLEGGRAPLEAVVLADCWGVATVVVRCQDDGLWHPYDDDGGTHTSPTLQLCQYHNINSPVCGRRASWESQTLLQFGREPRWPWLAALLFLETFICTATIISHSHLLTSAHCLARTSEDSSGTVDLRNLRVQHLGMDGKLLSRQFVSGLDVWPGFVGGSSPEGDVALLTLETNLTFSRYLQPACLSTQSFSYDAKAATFHRDLNSRIHGWELVVQRHDSRCASPQDVCARSLHLATDEQFCAVDTEGSKFLSQGSSGGPYLVNTGIDSWERWEVSGLVTSSHTHNQCPTPLTIFTHTTPFANWIFSCVYDGSCS